MTDPVTTTEMTITEMVAFLKGALSAYDAIETEVQDAAFRAQFATFVTSAAALLTSLQSGPFKGVITWLEAQITSLKAKFSLKK